MHQAVPLVHHPVRFTAAPQRRERKSNLERLGYRPELDNAKLVQPPALCPGNLRPRNSRRRGDVLLPQPAAYPDDPDQRSDTNIVHRPQSGGGAHAPITAGFWRDYLRRIRRWSSWPSLAAAEWHVLVKGRQRHIRRLIWLRVRTLLSRGTSRATGTGRRATAVTAAAGRRAGPVAPERLDAEPGEEEKDRKRQPEQDAADVERP